MTDTIESVAEVVDQQQLAKDLVEAARADGMELVGPGGPDDCSRLVWMFMSGRTSDTHPAFYPRRGAAWRNRAARAAVLDTTERPVTVGRTVGLFGPGGTV